MIASVHDETPATRLAQAELEAAVDRGTDLELRVEAFKELSRRGAPSAPARAAALLHDSRATPALRTAAAVALGKRAASKEGQDALIGALDTADASLLRKVCASLGRTGDESALAALRKVEMAPEHSARQALDFARSLIAYRHGLDEELLQPPPDERLARVDPAAATPFTWAPLDASEIEREAESLARQLPAIAVSRETAVQFRCGARGYWLLLSPTVVSADGIERLSQNSAVAAVVLRHDECSGTHYVDEYIAANPAAGGTGALVGVRPSGAIVHSGRYEPRPEGLSFSLRAILTPYARPLQLQGMLQAGGRPSLETARTMKRERRAREPSRQPRKDAG